jgi:hypothetical protein
MGGSKAEEGGSVSRLSGSGDKINNTRIKNGKAKTAGNSPKAKGMKR